MIERERKERRRKVYWISGVIRLPFRVETEKDYWIVRYTEGGERRERPDIYGMEE